MGASILGGAVLVLAGCTTFGTNINGSFACGPSGEGSCAPATVIDDRALAEITGEASYIPAGPYRAPLRDLPQSGVVLASGPVSEIVPPQQKVLRIVFPAHVDRAGRYHETSVVKALVDNGTWMQASASHGAALAQTVNLTVNPDILSQLGDEVTSSAAATAPLVPQLGYNDPALPSPEAVAAARARAAAKRASSSPAAAGEPADKPVTVNRPAVFNPVVEE